MKRLLNADEILRTLPSKYYVINLKTKEIVQTNDRSVSENNNLCYKFLFNKEYACGSNSDGCICQRAIQSGKESNCIIDKVSKNNTEFFKANVTVIDDDLVIANYENISDLVKVKKELKINSKRLARAEKLTDFGYWEFNIDDKIMLASQGAKDIYGVNSGLLTLDEAQRFPLKRYRSNLNKQLNDLIVLGKPYNVKFKIKRKDTGEIRCVHSIAEYREDKKMVFGVIHDITETQQIQSSLKESEHNLKQLFKNMNSGFAYHEIIVNDKKEPIDYKFLDVNAKFEEITGLKRSEILNKRVLELMPNTESSWIKRYGEVALTGKPVTFNDYSVEMDKHFEVAVYSPKKNFFAVTFSEITQRIKVREDLEESLLDLKLAQQIANIGNWKYNPETEDLNWSSQVYQIFEKKKITEPVDYHNLKNYFDEKDYQILGEAIDESLFNNKGFEIQLKLLLPKNNFKWIEVICLPGKKAKNNEYFLRGTVQDITASKKAEDGINYSNKLLRTVIDNIPDAIYMKDINCRKLIANKGDAINCGVESVDEIVGKTDYDLYPKEVAEIYTDDDLQVINEGKTIFNRQEILPQKDKERIILTSKFPLKNEDDEIVGLVGIGRDITELKEHELRLQLLQQTIEQVPIGVMITNTKGEIEYVNPGFEKSTGYSFNDVLGKNPNILKSEKHPDRYYKKLWETITSGETWYGEFHNRKKDGTLYWESTLISPISNDKGEIKHFVAIKEDVSEKKQMIEDLKKSKEKAEESDRLKSIFLTNMSHEIRTPLNGILGFSNVICSGITDKNKLEYYGDIINNSGRRLIKVIDDIIDISMIQSNQMDFVFDHFDLNDLLTELYRSFKIFKAEKLNNIEFDLELCRDKNWEIVYSDKTKLNQVFENLLENAFKFTKTGAIKFGCFKADKNSLTLFVKDSGVGIPKEKVKLIFEAFRQAEEGDSRKFEGSGLGLAISAAIMEKLGGEIQVESQPGKGSVFYLKFFRDKI